MKCSINYQWSRVRSWWVCVFVCVSVCLCVCVSARGKSKGNLLGRARLMAPSCAMHPSPTHRAIRYGNDPSSTLRHGPWTGGCMPSSGLLGFAYARAMSGPLRATRAARENKIQILEQPVWQLQACRRMPPPTKHAGALVAPSPRHHPAPPPVTPSPLPLAHLHLALTLAPSPAAVRLRPRPTLVPTRLVRRSRSN